MDAFSIFARIALDSSEYDSGLDDALGKAKSIGSKIGSGLATAGKVGAAAIGAATTAVGALTKASVDGYANYEQLAGGVQKLFGDASDQMMKYAENAYKTSGLSANEYMEQSTSFAAALINSLDGDTAAAANQADVAMRAISDNFNTFGGDIENVQNAFQGFAKQNYTMLDNLKLGYGGTKTEMERLIADANEYAAANGEAANLTIDSFSDIVTAIDLIQQKQNIAGTTAKEAATTVSGSLGMLKSAWDNLVTGFANPDADMGELINNVVESAETAFGNLLPVAEQALIGIGDFISEMAPVIAEKLPELAEQLLPKLIETATSLVISLASALPSLAVVIVEQIPQIISQITTAFMDALPELQSAGQELLSGFAEAMGDGESLLSSGGEAIANFIDGAMDRLPDIVSAAGEIISNFVDGVMDKLPDLISSGGEIITNIIDGIGKSLPSLISSAGDIISSLVEGLIAAAPSMIDSAGDIIQSLIEGLISALPAIASAAVEIVGGLVVALIQNAPQLLQSGIELVGKLAAGLIKSLPDIIAAALELINGIKDKFLEIDWAETGLNLVKGIAKGILNGASEVLNAAKDLAGKVLNKFKNVFKEHSPSRETAEDGKNLVLGLAKGIKENESEATKKAEELASKMLSAAKTRLENDKVYHKWSLEAEKAYWDGVRQQIKEGTQARIDADKQYFEIAKQLTEQRKALVSAQKSVRTTAKTLTKEYSKSIKQVKKQLQADIKSVRKAMKADLAKVDEDLASDLKKVNEDLAATVKQLNEDLISDINKLTDEYNKSVESRAKSIMNFTGLFDKVSIDRAYSKDYLLETLNNQVNSLQRWDSELDALESRIGKDNPLLEEIQEMGVSALYTLKELNSMSDAELEKYVALYNEKARVAQERALQENETLKAQTEQEIEALRQSTAVQISEAQAEARKARAELRAAAAAEREQIEEEAEENIKSLKKAAKKQVKELTKQYKSDLKALAKEVKPQGKSVGQAMIDGMKDGINDKKSPLISAARKVAKEALKAMKDELKIKSPSRVFRDEVGKNIDLGVAEGLRMYSGSISDQFDKMFDFDAPFVSVSSPTSQATSSETRGGDLSMVFNVYGAPGQDEETLARKISDIINMEVYRDRAAKGMAYGT